MINNRQAEITIPIDIPDVAIVAMEIKEKQIIITVETLNRMTCCGVCGDEIECKHGRGEMVSLRHLPILGCQTTVQLRPRRAKCPTCVNTPTTTQTVSWYTQRSPHTKAYDERLMALLKGSTVSEVSRLEGIGYDAIVGALEREIPNEVDWERIERLDTVGIDEVSARKGHKGYRAIVTARSDDGELHLLAVLPDRKKRR